MKKEKNIIIIMLVSFTAFILVFSIFQLSRNKEEYSCYDYETNTTYTFKTEKEMQEVCSSFNGAEEDNTMNSYNIYEELINTDDRDGFSFDPYVRNNELVIIVQIIDCDNPGKAKEKAKAWFKEHSYNINNFTIEYETPCE